MPMLPRTPWLSLVALQLACVHHFPGPGEVPSAQQYEAPGGAASPLAEQAWGLSHAKDFVHDPHLDEVAQVLADDVAAASGDVPGPHYLNWLLARRGVASRSTRAWSGWVRGNSRAARLDEQLAQALQESSDLAGKRFGIARSSERPPGAQVLVLAESKFTLDPFKRHALPGEVLTISGRVAGTDDVTVEMYGPGEPKPRLVDVAADGAWEPQQWTLPQRSGRYWLEIRSSHKTGVLLPVLVGDAADALVDVGDSPAELEAAVRAWAAQVRAAAGLAPLGDDAAADAIVRRRAELQAAAPGESEASLRALGYRVVRWTYQSNDRARGNELVFDAIDRPSEMGILLDPRAQHLAIGAARNGQAWWLVLETLSR